MDYISVKEAADKWKVKVRTIQNFCANGKIPGAKILGKQWIIPSDAILPVDRRKKMARGIADSGRYLFPFIIYSSSYSNPSELNENESTLFHAQMAYLKAKYAESIQLCKSLLKLNIPDYLKMGAHITISHCAIPLGIHYEYKTSLDKAEAICNTDELHKEDYKLLIASLKYHIGWNHEIFDNINIDKLTPLAIPYYQFELILVSSLSEANVLLRNVHLCNLICNKITQDGIPVLETMAHFALANLYIKLLRTDEAYNHFSTACTCAASNQWMHILYKNHIFSPSMMKECLSSKGEAYYDAIVTNTTKNLESWRIINKIEAGLVPLNDIDFEDLAIFNMIHQGLPKNEIVIISGISTKELNAKLKKYYETYNVKNIKELKKFLDKQFATWLAT